MRLFKKISCMMLAAMMLFSVVFVATPQTAQAADKGINISYYSKNKIMVGRYNKGYEDFSFDSYDYTIKNLKSSSKNLLVKKTYDRSYLYKSSFANSDFGGSYCSLQYYAKKAGTYRITFDIYKGNKKISSEKITVKAVKNILSPIKSITVDGKKCTNHYMCETKKSSVKLKFTLNKGYRLKAIFNSYTDNKGDNINKKIRNGSSFKTSPFKYTVEKNDDYSSEKEIYDNFESRSSAIVMYTAGKDYEFTSYKNGKKKVDKEPIKQEDFSIVRY